MACPVVQAVCLVVVFDLVAYWPPPIPMSVSIYRCANGWRRNADALFVLAIFPSLNPNMCHAPWETGCLAAVGSWLQGIARLLRWDASVPHSDEDGCLHFGQALGRTTVVKVAAT